MWLICVGRCRIRNMELTVGLLADRATGVAAKKPTARPSAARNSYSSFWTMRLRAEAGRNDLGGDQRTDSGARL